MTAAPRNQDIAAIKAEAASNPEATYKAAGYPGELKREGSKGLFGICPFHDDAHPSFHLTIEGPEAGLFHCFGCNEGGSILDFYLKLNGRTAGDGRGPLREAVEQLAGKLGISVDGSADKRSDPEQTYDYVDAHGKLLYQVCRLPGRKFSQRRPDPGGGWIWNLKGVTRVLYQLPPLLADPAELVVVCEGEKDADAVNDLASGPWATAALVATTNSGGAGKWRKEYAETLRGRDVAIVPDNDEPGRKHGQQVAASLAGIARTVKVVDLPDLPEKGDVSDYLRAGHDLDALLALVTQTPLWEPSAEPVTAEGAAAGESGRTETCAQILLALAADDELFHDPRGVPYAAVQDGKQRRAILPVAERGSYYRALNVQRYREQEGKPPNNTALCSVMEALGAQAVTRGESHEVYLRVAEHDGTLYLDLANPAGEVVAVTADGWEVTTSEPVRWRRPHDMYPLPTPVQGGSVEPLREWLNLEAEQDFVLVVSWLLAALRPGFPYPVLVFSGEQGTAKTTAERVLRFLVDPVGPDGAGLLRQPREEDDLAVVTRNRHVLAFDNLSHLPPWLSDALSALATGTGWACRTLFTNTEETVIYAKRPIILNGITDVATRGDLLDRALVVTLPLIPDEKRVGEAAFWSPVRELGGFVLGGLLDAVAMALRNLPGLPSRPWPRMADFAQWIVAAEPALPWSPGSFEQAYQENRSSAIQTTLEASVLADELRELAGAQDRGWQGTANDLREHLLFRTPDLRKEKRFPRDATRLAGEIRKLAPALRAGGVDVKFERSASGRQILLRSLDHDAV